MLARVITLRFEPVLEAFHDAPLRAFVKDKEVFAIRDHFFHRDDLPYLAVLVTYGLRAPASPTETPAKRKGRGDSWRALTCPCLTPCGTDAPSVRSTMASRPIRSAPTGSS